MKYLAGITARMNHGNELINLEERFLFDLCLRELCTRYGDKQDFQTLHDSNEAARIFRTRIYQRCAVGVLQGSIA